MTQRAQATSTIKARIRIVQARKYNGVQGADTFQVPKKMLPRAFTGQRMAETRAKRTSRSALPTLPSAPRRALKSCQILEKKSKIAENIDSDPLSGKRQSAALSTML